MVKVVVLFVESAKVTLPLFTTHLSNDFPLAGSSAVIVTVVPASYSPPPVPPLTVTVYFSVGVPSAI